MRLTLVACIRRCDNAIGYAQPHRLLYHIPAELKHFSHTTTHTTDSTKQNVVVMGYTTYVSLGCKPLPGRINHVISCQHYLSVSHEKPDGVHVFRTPEESLAWCLASETLIETVYLIGGTQLYESVISAYNRNMLPQEFELSAVITWIEEVNPAPHTGTTSIIYFQESFEDVETGWKRVAESSLITSQGRESTSPRNPVSVSYRMAWYEKIRIP